MWVAFAFAKASHIFFSKNTCELEIVLTRIVNILTTNELVKLTMLWTTGPWYISGAILVVKMVVNFHQLAYLGLLSEDNSGWENFSSVQFCNP